MVVVLVLNALVYMVCSILDELEEILTLVDCAAIVGTACL